MNMSWEVVITGIFTFLAGGGGKWVIDLIKSKTDSHLQEKRADSEISLSETEKAFIIYKEIVIGLKKDVEILSQNLQGLDKERVEFREKCAKLTSDNTYKDQIIADLRAKIQELENEPKN